MTADPKEVVKEGILRRIEAIRKQRKTLDEEENALNESLTAYIRSELKRSGAELPYLDGRIGKHILDILNERGPTPAAKLKAILEAGGAGRLKKKGQIDKSLRTLMRGGKVIETAKGLDIGHTTKPVQRSHSSIKRGSNG